MGLLVLQVEADPARPGLTRGQAGLGSRRDELRMAAGPLPWQGLLFRNLANGRESSVGVSFGPTMLEVPVRNAPCNFLVDSLWDPCFVLLLLFLISVGIAVRTNNAGNLRHFPSLCLFLMETSPECELKFANDLDRCLRWILVHTVR